MGKRIHSLAQYFFEKETVDDCSLDEIHELVNKYPYASAARFLLLHKLQHQGQPQAEAGKAILYYHDPVSFQYFMRPENFITELPEEEIAEATIYEEQEKERKREEDEEARAEQLKEKEKEKEKEEEEEAFLVGRQNGQEDPTDKAPEFQGLEDVASAFKEPLKQEESVSPAFEPFHTVDYFASQGIRLSQEDFGRDQFGKQLKSFTEWLKSMKRLPAPENSAPDPGTENKVQHLAEHSVNQSEVVTEAMAEVWIKQGNKTKAIEVYNKLSLLNPSKSAYFATQIENLKRS